MIASFSTASVLTLVLPAILLVIIFGWWIVVVRRSEL